MLKIYIIKKAKRTEFLADENITILDLARKNEIDIEREFRKLPPLIKAYIRVGAWIGPGAIVDSKFDTTDVLIVLNSKKILKKYAQLSFEKTY